MSAPNGQGGVKTPSKTSTPVPSGWTVQSDMDPPVSQGVDSGQSNPIASAAQATHTSMNSGRRHPAGSHEGLPQHPPGHGKGRGVLSASSSMPDATSQAPSEGGGGGQTQSVLGKRHSDEIYDAINGAWEKRRAAKAAGMVTTGNADDSENFTIKDKSSEGGRIEVVFDPTTEKGWEIILGAFDKFEQQRWEKIDGIYLWFEPYEKGGAREESQVDSSLLIRPGQPCVTNTQVKSHPDDTGDFNPDISDRRP